ncbi:hypothetical protein [Shewanella baltica]|uniref:hypothetical protein n=1 Tax=Shewanella baltica TaxID=62322 RepID=UPI0039B0C737
MKPLSLSERLNQFATDQDDLSRRGEKNLATEAAQVIDLLTAERDQLAAYVERFNKTMADLSVDADDSDDDPIPCSLWELFEVTPKQCLNHVRAKAVMNFAEFPRDVYLSGTVTAELTVYDVYQLARYHLKANYGYDTQPWDDDDATTARNSLNELSAQVIRKFVSDTNETGQLSFPDCQWLEQWRDEWLEEAAKGGE